MRKFVGICLLGLLVWGVWSYSAPKKPPAPVPKHIREKVSAIKKKEAQVNRKGLLGIIRQSDDYAQHGKVFLKTAQTLIGLGKCTVADFRNNGGRIRSASHAENYFMYRGKANRNNRIYLNVRTGKFAHSDPVF